MNDKKNDKSALEIVKARRELDYSADDSQFAFKEYFENNDKEGGTGIGDFAKSN